MTKESRMQADAGHPENAEEGLNGRVRVITPGVIAVLIILSVIFIAVIVWALVWKIPVKKNVKGLVTFPDYYDEEIRKDYFGDSGNIYVICTLDASEVERKGLPEIAEEVTISASEGAEATGRVAKVLEQPLYYEQVKMIFIDNEWMMEQCGCTENNWVVIIKASRDVTEYILTLVDVTFLMDEVSPISFLSSGGR